MPSLKIDIREDELVKLVLEFLHGRDLHISMLAVERESGVINGCYSDDMLFLRQLILDGQWDDVIDFIQPLSAVETFDRKAFKYAIYKHKFLELLCIKFEVGGSVQPPQDSGNQQLTVDEVVTCLNTLQDLCPTKEDYSNLCLLLTLPRLSDHAEYQEWNPSSGRVQCFQTILPLVEKFLILDSKHDNLSQDRLKTAHADRLVKLCVKGLLYEACVDFCQRQATGSPEYDAQLHFSDLLNGAGFSDADVSLLSWLQAIPQTTFDCHFEQKTVNLNLRPLQKPSLEASWCEQILITPIKPKMFPHSAVPSSRRFSADFMTRSLQPQYDGLAHGLATARRDFYNSPKDRASALSRSFAGGFQLTGSVLGGKMDARRSHMLESVDRLFEESSVIDTHSSVYIENTAASSPRMNTTGNSSGIGGSPQQKVDPAVGGASPPRSSASPHRKIERSESPLTRKENKNEAGRKSAGDVNKMADSVLDSSAELYREYQKQRLLLQEQLAEQEQKRLECQLQLEELNTQRLSVQASTDNRYIEDRDGNANASRHVKNAWPEKESARSSPARNGSHESQHSTANLHDNSSMATPANQQPHSNGVHSNQNVPASPKTVCNIHCASVNRADH